MKYIMFNKVKIYRVEIALFFGLVISIVCCFASIIGQSEDIGKHILRLHILANSDSEKDQNLKLQVRDEILNCFDFNYADNYNLYEIENQIKNELPTIGKIAKNAVLKAGYDYEIESEIVNNIYFDTREYDNFAMPAGKYDALRIKIGEAKGHNWWCVLVPSLCVPAANCQFHEKIENSLNPCQQDLVENGFKTEIRFAVIEIFEYIKNLFS